jgi:hypothetical protein
MAEIAEVKAPPSQKGKPKPRSGVASPYHDLDKSIDVARVIHTQGGGTCDRAQLALMLKYSGVNNGGFLSRVSSAKMFGLIEENGDKLTLTERAKQILSPVMSDDALKAKVQAFLGVEFFAQLFQRFNGQALPSEVGLKNLFESTYKIVPDRIIPALRVFMDSADSAGFFKMAGNRSRMTMPIATGSETLPPKVTPLQPLPATPQADLATTAQQHGGSGGGGNGGGIDPALLGLIKNLPPAGSKLGPKRRKALTDAFSATINFLYPEEEEEGHAQ